MLSMFFAFKDRKASFIFKTSSVLLTVLEAYTYKMFLAWDLPLTLSKLMSITKLAGKQSIWRVDKKAEVEICIFLKSILGTIIQDGGIRERRWTGCIHDHSHIIQKVVKYSKNKLYYKL